MEEKGKDADKEKGNKVRKAVEEENKAGKEAQDRKR